MPDAKRKKLGDRVRVYGLTLEQYDAKVLEQDGRCAICRRKPDPEGDIKFRRLHIDHCHVTNGVRGLLCQNCNIMLGQSKDDPETLMAGAKYLIDRLKPRKVS